MARKNTRKTHPHVQACLMWLANEPLADPINKGLLINAGHDPGEVFKHIENIKKHLLNRLSEAMLAAENAGEVDAP